MATSRSSDFCSRGHNLAEVGRYKGGSCKVCHRERVKRRQHEVRAQVKRRKPVYAATPIINQGGKPARTGRRTDDTIDASTYLALAEQKERAATHWERAAIEAQMARMRRGA